MSLSSCPRYDSGSQCSTGILHSCSNPWVLCCQSHVFPVKVPPSQPYQTGAPLPQPLFKKPQSLHIRTGLSQDLHILLAVKSSSMSYSVWIRITPQGRGPENELVVAPPRPTEQLGMGMREHFLQVSSILEQLWVTLKSVWKSLHQWELNVSFILWTIQANY